MSKPFDSPSAPFPPSPFNLRATRFRHIGQHRSDKIVTGHALILATCSVPANEHRAHAGLSCAFLVAQYSVVRLPWLRQPRATRFQDELCNVNSSTHNEFYDVISELRVCSIERQQFHMPLFLYLGFPAEILCFRLVSSPL